VSAWRRNRLAWRLALGAVAVAALAVGLLAGGRSTRRPAPALPARALSGRAVTLADLRGHAAAVVFWASWCTDCRVEANAVEAVARSPAGRGRLVGIDYDDGGGWRAFLRRHHWSFPVLDDSRGDNGAAFGIDNLPATIILDSSGRIVTVRYGAQTVDGLTAALATAG
jgi:cytochrome c biogenesis protein CcmG, thiol:disulfide interchange protein DsbE